MIENYLTTEEFARLHNTNVNTVRSRIKNGQIASVKVGKIRLIKVDTPWEESRRANCGRYKKGSTNNVKKNPS